MSQDNIVYIGKKPVMSYVMAVLTTLNTRNAQSVELKARGNSITTAVDVAEITRNRYMSGLSRPVIKIETEKISDGERTRNVSCISITLSKEGIHEKTEEAAPAVDVSSIKGVGAVTAEKLREGGYGSVDKIRGATTADLAKATGLTEKQAENVIKAASELQG
jgi:DNA-binding protein